MATTDKTEQPTQRPMDGLLFDMPSTFGWAEMFINDTVDDFLKLVAQQPEDSCYRMDNVRLDAVVTVAITLKEFLQCNLAETREEREYRWHKGGAVTE